MQEFAAAEGYDDDDEFRSFGFDVEDEHKNNMDLEALAMNVCENFPWIVGMSVYLSYCIRNPSFQVAGESANNQELNLSMFLEF